MKQVSLETSHGRISVRDSGGDGPAVMLIHGNSSSGAVFRHLFEEDLTNRYRILAPDLPGHGESANATDPARTYSMPGYADAMTEVLNKLGVSEAIVFGWSLGGHIALEMISRYPGLKGVMITGSPPVAPDELMQGFIPSPHMGLAGQEIFSAEDSKNYAHSTCGEPFEQFLLDGVIRTDGKARKFMFEAFGSGVGANQRQIVGTAKLPLAVVNGVDEPFVNTDFVSSVTYANLWEGKCHLIAGSGHAPFWDAPEKFKPIFARFLGDVTSGKAAAKG